MFPKIVVPSKSSILVGFSIINHPFWGFSPLFFGETPIESNARVFCPCSLCCLRTVRLPWHFNESCDEWKRRTGWLNCWRSLSWSGKPGFSTKSYPVNPWLFVSWKMGLPIFFGGKKSKYLNAPFYGKILREFPKKHRAFFCLGGW